MANKFQIKRTSVTGRVATTSTIDVGELALNITDGKMFSSNGTVIFEIGANVDNQYIAGTLSTGLTTQQSNTANTTSTTATTISQWPTATYNSSKAIISAVSSGERQISELLILHNTSNAYATEYGVVISNSELFTVDCTLSGANVVIQVTSTSATATDYVIHETLFAG